MNENGVIEYIGAACILAGSVISVLSALGVIRFPDVYTRAHAATKSATLAVLLTLVGALIYIWVTEAYISIRLLLGIVFVFITAPVAGHLTIRAAYRSGVRLASITQEDELKSVLRKETERK